MGFLFIISTVYMALYIQLVFQNVNKGIMVPLAIGPVPQACLVSSVAGGVFRGVLGKSVIMSVDV